MVRRSDVRYDAAVDYLRLVAKEFRESGSGNVADGVDKAADALIDAQRHLASIAKAIDYPAESWQIAGCDVLAHAVADLQRNYIALRDSTKSEKRRMSDLIPTTWLDPLLTGPGAALPPMGTIEPKHIEALLRGLKKRIEEAENG